MSTRNLVKGKIIVYTNTMSDTETFSPRLSVQLSPEDRVLVLDIKTALAKMKLTTGHDETLRDFVVSAIKREAERRKLLRQST